ncbi:bacillithiol biosynthesis deacetylase BshB1 [Candidatus Contubernalis alkaliaceticus]|uniref:bacillithiol biosynthesis deacetylase BshB1 n=1 Tax=Candidatus Contubernalis alkaliaceticus TaxID=338645 RepID=UPI001F4C13C2|nr:bacillithiol biosynthesis deacetylase BshB1 [Candidatus Contubernalis alkalaceticus]UNC92458.1 bacillithiol biosynthesis deacetylase BshB1 [Candidatus Contubernalis alkalaceticus]
MLDILAFGAHPDDVEIGIGGTIAVHTAKGFRCGIVDLTQGERASHGTPEERAREGKEAARVLGAEVRECANLPDAFIKSDDKSKKIVIELIRKFRPRIVLCPYYEDNHPDHINGSLLVKEACHLSGLLKYPAEGKAYRPSKIFYYFLGKTANPTLLIDISSQVDKKWQAIACHYSQFALPSEFRVETEVNSPLFIQYLKSRDQFFGSFIKAPYAEGLVPEGKVSLPDLFLGEGK